MVALESNHFVKRTAINICEPAPPFIHRLCPFSFFFSFLHYNDIISLTIMYSYGSSARVGTGGKRGHGGRPYRPPPDRSKQDATPPPLKQCDCLIELDLAEYARPVANNNSEDNNGGGGRQRVHETFGSRQAMERTVKYVRSVFLCHLQIPGRNQGGPVALVSSSVEAALPACQYVMQQIVLSNNNNNNDETSDFSATARIHPNVKSNLPVVTGTLYKVNSSLGYLFRQHQQEQNSQTPSSSNKWCVAVYQMTPAENADESSSSPSQLESLQICMDNLRFRDSACQFQITSHGLTLFAMSNERNVDLLLAEIQQEVPTVGVVKERAAS